MPIITNNSFERKIARFSLFTILQISLMVNITKQMDLYTSFCVSSVTTCYFSPGI